MIPWQGMNYILSRSASRITSVSPDLWTPENPSYGHCAVFCLYFQKFYGGKIRRGLLPEEWQKKLGYRSHYWNELNNGEFVDLSRDQFPEDFPYQDFMEGKIGDTSDRNDKREYILKDSQTALRYRCLKENIKSFLRLNPILTDDKFQQCWELAFSEKAKCAKMRFAGVVYDRLDRSLVTSDVNRLMTEQFGRPRFCSLDGKECARVKLPSRQDPSIGDCGHASIWCLAKVFEIGYRPSQLKELKFYEAGFWPNGAPWERKEPAYTCLSCQNTFAVFGLEKVFVVYNGHWREILTKDSFYKAAGYATGEKKI